MNLERTVRTKEIERPREINIPPSLILFIRQEMKRSSGQQRNKSADMRRRDDDPD